LPLKKENEDNNESNSDKKVTSKRKPGKQAGAQGYGRAQKIDVTHYMKIIILTSSVLNVNKRLI